MTEIDAIFEHDYGTRGWLFARYQMTPLAKRLVLALQVVGTFIGAGVLGGIMLAVFFILAF